MSGTAMIVVDVQRDFVEPDSAGGVGSAAKAFCIPAIRQLRDLARRNGWQIVHVGTRHEDSSTLPAHHRRRGVPVYCKAGTPGCEFVVEPEPGELVVYKSWYSAFVDTVLPDQLAPDVEIIVWAGVATDCCIQQSVFDADRLGFVSVVPFQTVCASTAEAHVAGLISIAKSVGYVVDVARLLEAGTPMVPPLEVAEIDIAAREWFKAQQMGLPQQSVPAVDVPGHLAQGRTD